MTSFYIFFQQQAFTFSSFNSFIAALMNIIAFAVVNVFQDGIMSRLWSTLVAALMQSNPAVVCGLETLNNALVNTSLVFLFLW